MGVDFESQDLTDLLRRRREDRERAILVEDVQGRFPGFDPDRHDVVYVNAEGRYTLGDVQRARQDGVGVVGYRDRPEVLEPRRFLDSWFDNMVERAAKSVVGTRTREDILEEQVAALRAVVANGYTPEQS